MKYDEQEGLFDPRTIGQEFEAEMAAQEEAAMPILEGADLKPIEDGEDEETPVPVVEKVVRMPEKAVHAPEINPNITFADVNPKDNRGLEAIAAKMFLRTLDNPQFKGSIVAAERETGSVSFSQSENPVEHPLFRLIADKKTIERMRDIALSLRGEGSYKDIKTRGNAEMRAVKYVLERLSDALALYAKIRPSEVKTLLEDPNKARNERLIMQQIVDHVMKSYLTRDEVGWFEAAIHQEQRRQAREGLPSDVPRVVPLARHLAGARFVVKWLMNPDRVVFIQKIFIALRADTRTTISVEHADVTLQAEALRELKETYNSAQEFAHMPRTGTNR